MGQTVLVLCTEGAIESMELEGYGSAPVKLYLQKPDFSFLVQHLISLEAAPQSEQQGNKMHILKKSTSLLSPVGEVRSRGGLLPQSWRHRQIQRSATDQSRNFLKQVPGWENLTCN